MILVKEGIEVSKAEKITRELGQAISKSVSERRAVSISRGYFGIINPFDPSKLKISAAPSWEHIYGSYFSNFYAVKEILENTRVEISPTELLELFQSCHKCGIMRQEENFSICENCKGVNTTCEHSKISLTLFKLNDAIFEAWSKGVILCGYVAFALDREGWDSTAEIEIQGTGGIWHQVDVVGEKEDLVIMAECKQQHPKAKPFSKEMAMQALGAMDDLEKTMKKVSKKKEIRKMLVTTGEFAPEVKGIEEREDVILIDREQIFDEAREWMGRIWR
ncbi:MAG: restriction endonuclease [Candidatus Hadarchaeales archaeon]